jgi:hypothetical protein
MLPRKAMEDVMLQDLITEFLENLAITLADYAQCKA